MTESEKKLLSALAKMAAQYLETEQGNLDHLHMTAGQRTVRVLAEYGLVIDDGRNSRWTEAGKALLLTC